MPAAKGTTPWNKGLGHGLSLQMSTKFIEQAEAEILAMYGKQLQDNAAEAAAIERDERAVS